MEIDRIWAAWQAINPGQNPILAGAAVAPRRAQKESTVYASERMAALPEVADQELTGGGAEGDLAGPFAFRRLRAQVNQRVRWLEVVDLDLHQLLTS